MSNYLGVLLKDLHFRFPQYGIQFEKTTTVKFTLLECQEFKKFSQFYTNY